VAGMPFATAYSNAMFFVGYDVVRRRSPAFWNAARTWIFQPDPADPAEPTEEPRSRATATSKTLTEEPRSRATATLKTLPKTPTTRGKDCQGGGRRRKGKRSPLECRLLERTWHALFCQPCAQPPREADPRLPPTLRAGTRSFHPPSFTGRTI
jgi:hypothetical protein